MASADPLEAILAGIPLVGLSPIDDPAALCGDYLQRELVSTKRARLRKVTGGDFGRPRIAEVGQRMKKLSIETGRTHPTTGALLPPMEPWTCPDPLGAIRLYAQIIRAPDGTFKLGDFETPAELDKVRYMQAQKLVVVEPDESIAPLGDANPEAGRKYPGAPMDDEGAKLGHQLRALADELNLDAFRELCAENVDRHRRGPGRVGITNRDICERANRNKAQLSALAGYRFQTVETTRRSVNRLLEQGSLIELVPPQRIREDRTWKTLPRIFEVPRDIILAPPQQRRQRDLRYARGRRRLETAA